MKIIIAGKDWESSTYIRNAITSDEYQIQQITFNHFVNKAITPTPDSLLILNFSSSNLNDVQALQSFVAEWSPDLSRVISFIPPHRPDLRLDLAKAGLLHILELPFSQSELRLLIDEIIKENKSHPSYAGRSDAIQHYFQICDSILRIESNFARCNNMILPYFSTQLNFTNIYFFEMISEFEAELKYAFPPSTSNQKLHIDCRSLLPSFTANSLIINENLPDDQPINLYLKTIFNITAKSLAILPVIQFSKLSFLYLFINSETSVLTEAQKILLYHFQKILEWKFNSPLLNIDHDRPQPASYPASFFQGILDQLNFGIVIFNEALEIKYINREGRKLINFSKDNLSFATLTDVFGEQNTAMIKATMSLASGAFERPEIELRSGSGQKTLVGFTLTEYIDPIDHQKGYILSLKDITYTKELQEEMIRMDRLASLGVMASGIAHEIRNPLAGIKAIAQTFEEEFSKNDPKNEYVKRIIKQVNRLDDLLKSLFSYAKPPKPNRQFCELKELVNEVLSLLKQRMQKHNITFTQWYEKNLPAIFIDGAQIQQVLFNLILNSIEAIDKQGEIKLTARKVRKSDETFQRKPFYKKITDQPYIQILISDNGTGISPENLQQIFNPFFTTKNYGTGLGLSIVYQIVQENNGIIYFESEVNKGTQCHLFLPCFQTPNKEIGKK